MVVKWETLSLVETSRDTQKLLWRVDEVARATGLSRSFLYQQISAGRLETVHIGRACRITNVAVEKFINSLEDQEND